MLEQALVRLRDHPGLTLRKVSSFYETPALMPPDAPAQWDQPYLNLAVSLQTDLSPRELLALTQSVEQALGRTPAPKWAPRVIDVDIIAFEDRVIADDRLQIPHPRAAHRSFVLRPLAEIDADLVLPGAGNSVLAQLRALQEPLPGLMSILNITPDSFANTDQRLDIHRLTREELMGANYVDLGAESTRPGAETLDPEVEWQRLAPALETVQELLGKSLVRPKISIDTRNASTAERALTLGADLINDVSGLTDPAMVELVRDHQCDVVVMHSLTVPADPEVRLAADVDAVTTVLDWSRRKLDELSGAGIPPARVIVDPGLGFGKSAQQSRDILRRAQELTELPCRVLVGHSRKSYLQSLTDVPAEERDVETLAVTAHLIGKQIDILRVHNLDAHVRFLRVFSRI
jgi:2-amino-4-hydroxy-6-hydroxymethyldihydropteridine diphosphokinase/dihydropteroate synthase